MKIIIKNFNIITKIPNLFVINAFINEKNNNCLNYLMTLLKDYNKKYPQISLSNVFYKN